MLSGTNSSNTINLNIYYVSGYYGKYSAHEVSCSQISVFKIKLVDLFYVSTILSFPSSPTCIRINFS